MVPLSWLIFGKSGLDILATLSWLIFGQFGLDIQVPLRSLIFGKLLGSFGTAELADFWKIKLRYPNTV